MSTTESLRGLRVIQWGCGLMGQIFIRYLLEQGAELVGAIDANPALIGRDAGEITTFRRPLGVPIRPPGEAEPLFETARAHACIVATRSVVAEVYDALALAARHGVNAITTCEEAFYPWSTASEPTRTLHELAVAHGCTLTGSGYQDVFWGHLISVLAGATHRIDRIEGLSQYNVDDYGLVLAEKHGAGLSPDEFAARIATSQAPAYNWNGNQWLCGRLGWHIRSQRQELRPTTHRTPVPSRCLGTDIPAGHATGMRAVVITETEEGPVLETHSVGKVYAPEEVDLNEWTLVGEPSTTVTIRRPATPELTCATIVNRLPQLVAAAPGFVTTDRLPAPEYRYRPL
ncbi:MAG TPA: dihydrodipicolinate reductase [Polyangia bacterium]|nr:dihydrodipicolinate reductase [Polyangia bacterium]